MDNTELFKIKTQWEKHNWQEQTKSNATKKTTAPGNHVRVTPSFDRAGGADPISL